MNIKKVLPTGIFLFFTYLSYSQTVPGTLSYQGILMQADGITPFVDGSHSVEFNFYDVAIGGNLLGIGNRTVSVSTTKGLFTCIIGDGAANNAALPYSVGTQQVFVGIKVDGGTELSPRAQLTTTAYAFQAQSAYTISDDAITNSKLANDAVNTSELVNGSVTLAKLAVDAVDNSKLTNDAVNTSELVNGSVTSAKLADASVATIDLSDGSVTNAKLATGIDAAKLTTGVLPLSALPASTLTGSGTSGNVPFWTGATSFGNDASLFWDNANKRLGLGTPTPQSLVEISGDGSTRKSIRLTQTTANTAWTINNFETTASEGAGNFGINLNGSGNKFLINTGGNIGIGTTTPQSKLHLVNNGLTLRL